MRREASKAAHTEDLGGVNHGCGNEGEYGPRKGEADRGDVGCPVAG